MCVVLYVIKKTFLFFFVFFSAGFSERISPFCYTTQDEATYIFEGLKETCVSNGKPFIRGTNGWIDNERQYCAGVVCGGCDNWYEYEVKSFCCVEEHRQPNPLGLLAPGCMDILGLVIGAYELSPPTNVTFEDFCTSTPGCSDGEGPSSDSGEEPSSGSGEEPSAGSGGEPSAGSGGDPSAGSGGDPSAGSGGDPSAGSGGDPSAGSGGPINPPQGGSDSGDCKGHPSFSDYPKYTTQDGGFTSFPGSNSDAGVYQLSLSPISYGIDCVDVGNVNYSQYICGSRTSEGSKPSSSCRPALRLAWWDQDFSYNISDPGKECYTALYLYSSCLAKFHGYFNWTFYQTADASNGQHRWRLECEFCAASISELRECVSGPCMDEPPSLVKPGGDPSLIMDGGDCDADMNYCNWARYGTQLEELGVSEAIRDTLIRLLSVVRSSVSGANPTSDAILEILRVMSSVESSSFVNSPLFEEVLHGIRSDMSAKFGLDYKDLPAKLQAGLDSLSRFSPSVQGSVAQMLSGYLPDWNFKLSMIKSADSLVAFWIPRMASDLADATSLSFEILYSQRDISRKQDDYRLEAMSLSSGIHSHIGGLFDFVGGLYNDVGSARGAILEAIAALGEGGDCEGDGCDGGDAAFRDWLRHKHYEDSMLASLRWRVDSGHGARLVGKAETLNGLIFDGFDAVSGGIREGNALIARLDSVFSAGSGDILSYLEGISGSCSGLECGDYSGIGDGAFGGLDTSGIRGARWDSLLSAPGSGGLVDSVSSVVSGIRSATATPFSDGVACPANELSVDACGYFGRECRVSLCDDMFYISGRHFFEWIGVFVEFAAWVIFLVRVA